MANSVTVYEFKESERQTIGIVAKDSENYLIGIVGYDMKIAYDSEKLNTHQEIAEAAAAFGKAIMQIILDDKFAIDNPTDGQEVEKGS